MKNKNILELCLSPDLGGLELYMYRCAKALHPSFRVISVVTRESRLAKYFSDSELEYLKIKKSSRLSISTIFRLAKIIDKNNIDVIHFHWTKDMPLIVMAKILSKKKPTLVQTRHMTMTRFKSDIFHRLMYKNINMILCVTNAVSEQISRFIPVDIKPKTEVLYPGADNFPLVNPDELTYLRQKMQCQDCFMVGLVGRINKSKGQHILIEAIRQLHEKKLPIKAFIIGDAMDNNYLTLLKKRVGEYDLKRNVVFLGFIKKPYKIMQACDVLLTTSKNETFGLVTVEAMKNNTAVIATDGGGTLEIIDDEKNGLLFRNQDPTDLASKITTLYHDSQLKNKLAAAGKKKSDMMFDNEKHFHKLSKIFKKI